MSQKSQPLRMAPVPPQRESLPYDLLGFVDSLAAAEKDLEAWDELSAAYGVVRMAEDSVSVGRPSHTLIEVTTRNLSRVRDLTARTALERIIEAADAQGFATPGDHRAVLCARLVAYGKRLHLAGWYGAASDVFAVVIRFEPDDLELVAQATAARAWSLRLHQRFDAANEAYDALGAIGRELGRPGEQLEAQLGRAKVLMDRGAYIAARPIVERVLGDAIRFKLDVIVGKCYLEHARIAGVAHDPASAAIYLFDALPYLCSTIDRDHVYVSLIHSFRELGDADTARALAEWVTTRAVEADQRAEAMIARYHLALDARDALTAGACRRVLGALHMAPLNSMGYFVALARDHSQRKKKAKAEEALRRMLAVAHEHDLAEYIVRADGALDDLRHGREPALYEFRPTERAIGAAKAKRLDRVKQAIEALCAA